MSISEGLDILGDGMRESIKILDLVFELEFLENEVCEKWKRFFSFKKRRGYLIGGVFE